MAHGGETVERALAKLEQAVDEVLKAGDGGLRGMHGYGSQAHHTHRMEGAGQAEWAFTSKCKGKSWQRIKIPGPWSGCCFQPRKNWVAVSNHLEILQSSHQC